MNNQRPRVAVLMGGPSREHEVSLNSGRQVLSWLNEDTYEIWRIVIDKENKQCRFYLHAPGAKHENPNTIVRFDHALSLLETEFDVVLPILHGNFGEDGILQSILDTLNVRYIGSAGSASAASYNKQTSNHIYQSHDLLTPKSLYIPSRYYPSIPASALRNIIQLIGLPAVVKPISEGSSFGVQLANTPQELLQALDEISSGESGVLIQEKIEGREVTCGIYEDKNAWALPLTEIKPRSSSFFDYDAKYQAGATDEITPADLPFELTSEVQRQAMVAHKALGCKDLSRSDFMIDKGGQVYILETNTMPGMTETSLYPQAVEASGMTMTQVFDSFISRALK